MTLRERITLAARSVAQDTREAMRTMTETSMMTVAVDNGATPVTVTIRVDVRERMTGDQVARGTEIHGMNDPERGLTLALEMTGDVARPTPSTGNDTTTEDDVATTHTVGVKEHPAKNIEDAESMTAETLPFLAVARALSLVNVTATFAMTTTETGQNVAGEMTALGKEPTQRDEREIPLEDNDNGERGNPQERGVSWKTAATARREASLLRLGQRTATQRSSNRLTRINRISNKRQRVCRQLLCRCRGARRRERYLAPIPGFRR
jgi:hypothetical protein